MRLEPLNSQIASEIRKTEGAKKISTTDKAKSGISEKADSHTFSSDATKLSINKADAQVAANQIANESDVRADKVAEVKAKIEKGYYNTPEFLDKLADRLTSFFGVEKR